MKPTHLIFVFFFLLVLIPTIKAQPWQFPVLEGNLEIIPPVLPYIPVNQSIYVYISVMNETNILTGNQVHCIINVLDFLNPPITKTFTPSVNSQYLATFNSTELPLGEYQYNIICNTSDRVGSAIEGFDVTASGGEPDKPNSGLILLTSLIPILFGIALLYGSSILSKEHTYIRLFAILLLPFEFISSIHLLVLNLIHFYHFQILENAVTSNVYVYGVIAFILFSYFTIYTFLVGFNNLKARRRERLGF